MKKLIFIILFLAFEARAWTLANSTRSGFQGATTINIYIAADSCTNAGLTPSSIQTLAQDAVAEFWNKVSTSSLKLNVNSITTTSLSGDTLTTAVNKTPTNSIIIGCNQNSALFTSNNILAVGGMGCAGSFCAGAVIINDVAGTNMASVDRQTVISTIAHELGHAIGLGHTSVKSALMYYDSTGVVNKALHQDDIDGVSYLYPNEKKVAGLAGACGSVDLNNNDKGNFFISLLAGLLLTLGFYHYTKRNFYVSH